MPKPKPERGGRRMNEQEKFESFRKIMMKRWFPTQNQNEEEEE